MVFVFVFVVKRFVIVPHPEPPEREDGAGYDSSLFTRHFSLVIRSWCPGGLRTAAVSVFED